MRSFLAIALSVALGCASAPRPEAGGRDGVSSATAAATATATPPITCPLEPESGMAIPVKSAVAMDGTALTAEGVWMSPKLAARYACNDQCCQSCQSKLVTCGSGTDWRTVGLAVLAVGVAGFAGGAYLGYKAFHEGPGGPGGAP